MTRDQDQKDNSVEMENNTQQQEVDSDNTSRSSKETGGPKGLEPTRYGDWERKGRCIDF